MLCRQVVSSTLTSAASFIFVLCIMFLFGTFFVSAKEPSPKATPVTLTVVSTTTTSSNNLTGNSPISPMVGNDMTPEAIRATRLDTILAGLDGITISNTTTSNVQNRTQFDIKGKKREAQAKFAAEISTLKSNRRNQKNTGSQDLQAARKEYESLKNINAGLKLEISKSGDPMVSANVPEASYLMTLQDIYIPTDPLYTEQWYISRILETTKGLWFIPTNSQYPAIVAVIDAGVDFTHEDIRQSKWESTTCANERGEQIGTCSGGYDFVDNDTDPRPSDGAIHGTAVASLIAASTDNEIGIASLSRGSVKVMSLRVADNGVLETDNIVRAILFAVHNGAKMINMSFAGPTYSRQLEQAMLYAEDHGVTMVVAAGNAGLNLDVSPSYPASYNLQSVITAGAIDQTGAVTAWSNYGKAVDVFSPGARILAAVGNNSYGQVDGTSFSAPIVLSYLITKTQQGVGVTQALKELPTVATYKSISKKGTVLGGGRALLGQKQPKNEVLTALQKDSSGKWFNPQTKGGEYVSNPNKFTLQAINYSLGLPALSTPGNTTQPGPALTAGTITFRWGSVSGAASYGLYVRDLTTNTLVIDCNRCTTGTSKSYSTLVAGRSYRWNMNSWDAAGNNSSAYTSPFYFTVVAPVATLAAPGSLTPGTTASPGTILTSSSQTLQWTSVTGSTGYSIQFTNTSTGVVNSYTTANLSLSVSTTPGQSFKWRVRTKNSAGVYGSYSPYFYFQIKAPQNTAPTVPTVAGSGAAVVDSNYIIGFATTDAQSDQVKFEVQWDANNTSSFTTYGYYAAGERSGNASRVYTSPGTYCIKARAVDLPGAASSYSSCHNVTVAAAAVSPTLSVTPATQTVTSGTYGNFNLTTTNVTSCTLSGNGIVNSPLTNINANYSIGPLSTSATYTITCIGTSGATISQNFIINVSAVSASPAVTFTTVPSAVNGTAFNLAFTTTNIPSGSVITLSPSMGNITPSSITLSGSSYSGNVVIKSASGAVTLTAKYNDTVVGTSNAFTVSNGATCSASLTTAANSVIVRGDSIPLASSSATISVNPLSGTYEQSGLCAPANTALAEPYLISPGTQTSPGTQYSTTTLLFKINPVAGATSYEMYLRNIATNVLYTFPMTGTEIGITGLGFSTQWRWNAAAKGSDGRLGWVTDVNYFTIAPNTSNTPTFTLSPASQTIASGGTASLVLSTTFISSCTLSGGGYANTPWGSMVNGTLNIPNIPTSVTYSIACLAQNGTTLTRTADVVVSATAPKVTFSTLGAQVNGTVFPLTVSTANIPTGSTIALSSTMGTVYPSSIVVTGTTWSGNTYITSATGNISLRARYNGALVGTSNTFVITSPPESCLTDTELNGLCVPPSPNTPPPPNLSPGTVNSPGPEVASISQTFTWSPISGSTRYAFYLRDLDSGDLIISTENVTTNSYTYNYLGAGKKYKWNVVAFDSTGKGGWSADPVYFSVKAGLTQPARTASSLTQDELSLCPEGTSCAGYTYTAVVIDSGTSLQDLSSETQAFIEGAEDELFVTLGGTAIGAVGVVSAKTAVGVISPMIEKKLGKKAAVFLGAKFIPGVGLVVITYTASQIVIDTADISGKCFTTSGTISTDPDFQFNRPSQYYCGRLTVRSTFIALGGAYIKLSPTKAVDYVEIKKVSLYEKNTEVLDETLQDAWKMNLVKTQPTAFRNGTDFGKRINSLFRARDPNTISQVSQTTGKSVTELQTYTHVQQVQINLPNGGYMIADDVLVKEVLGAPTRTFMAIVNESKLSGTTALSTRQGQFLSYLQGGVKDFTTRSLISDVTNVLPQNTKLTIEYMIKSSGDGTSNGTISMSKLY